MRLWRLSSARRARDFDGGYGVFNDGRWNSRGRPVTYCSNVASLTALEKRVHVTDPTLLPRQVLVTYELPDDITQRAVDVGTLPPDWIARQTHTQAVGDRWLDSAGEALLFVPSVIVPFAGIPDRNVMINHRSRSVASIRIVDIVPFILDARLFRP